jgi:hypothetical protein
LKPTKLFYLVSAFGVVILLGLIIRLGIGVCVYDEGFYIEVARSIIAWQRPFLVSVSIAQTSSGMLIPFIQLWYLAGLGDQGLVLWMRVLYLITNCGCAFALFSYARRRLDSARAILVSMLGLVWIPFGIPAPSYYTLAANSFLCGLICYCLSKGEHDRVWLPRLADALFAIGCLAFPPLALPCLAFLVARVLLAPDKTTRNKRLTSIVCLASIGFGSLLFLALFCGTGHLMNSVMVARSLAGFYKSDMIQIMHWVFGEKYYPLLLSITFLAAVGATFKSNIRSGFLSMVVFMIALVTTAFLNVGLMSANSHLEVLLLFIFFTPIALRDPNFTEESRVVFWTSALAALTFTFSSGSGPVTFCLGAYPGVCVAMIELLANQERTRSQMLLTAGTALCAVTVTVLFVCAVTTIYGDKDLDWSHTVRVQSGPFCWLRTTPSKRYLITKLKEDLDSYGKPYKTIYVIGPPGWYLCSALKPLDLILWHSKNLDSVASYLKNLYKEYGRPDVIVLATHDSIFGIPNKFDLELLKQSYLLTVTRPDYLIFIAAKPEGSRSEELAGPH